MERKIFQSEVKEYDEKNLIVEHFISTESRDRGGDVMLASGMEVKGRVVVLVAHGYGREGMEPVAKPLSIKPGEHKSKKGIIAKTQFFSDQTGKRLFEKTTQGYAPNWSVGFLPLETENVRDEEGRPTRIVKRWELLEYSIVGTPMQPEAQTLSDADKLAAGISFKIFNAHLLQNSEGGTITIVNKEGRALSYEEVKRAIEQEVSAFYWSIRSAK